MSEVQAPVSRGEHERVFRTPPNLTLRMMTAALGVPLTLFLVGLGGWALFGLALVVGVIALLEFYALARGRASQGSARAGVALLVLSLLLAQNASPWSWFVVLVGVASVVSMLLVRMRGTAGWRMAGWQALATVGGALYVGFPLVAMLRLRMAATDGALWLLLVLALTWVTDSASYFAGRAFGKRALAPRISPKKTCEGALGGWLGGSLAGYLVLQLGGQFTYSLIPLLILAPLSAILGDLWESGLKRYFQSKDSGLTGFNLFPGHGGVLDRVDSLLFVAPTVVLYLAVTTTVFQAGA